MKNELKRTQPKSNAAQTAECCDRGDRSEYPRAGTGSDTIGYGQAWASLVFQIPICLANLRCGQKRRSGKLSAVCIRGSRVAHDSFRIVDHPSSTFTGCRPDASYIPYLPPDLDKLSCYAFGAFYEECFLCFCVLRSYSPRVF